MEVAVFYEESYTLYDQFHERSIQCVIGQRDNESDEEFSKRMDSTFGNVEVSLFMV